MRYRVHCNATFDVDIEAKNMAEARIKAGEISELPLFVAAADMIGGNFGWNWIEALGLGGDDERG